MNSGTITQAVDTGETYGDLAATKFKSLLYTDDYRLKLEPVDLTSGWQIAEICAKTRFCGVTSPDDAYLRIMLGRAIGLPALASVQGIALFENKKGELIPCMYSKVKVALLLSRNDVIEYIYP